MTLPLEGLRVLDLTRLLPGPYASLVLADLGAEVLKIEAPGVGDYLRHMPPAQGPGEDSALFHALNRNKKSLALDLKRPEGVELFLELVRGGYDVVLESFRPGVLERLGLGYEALKAACPQVILASISGYGQTGPLRQKAGHDLNYLARAGVLAFTGAPGGPPVVSGVQVADVAGGSWVALSGLLAALVARGLRGEGAWVDVSMTEGALSLMTPHLGAAQVSPEALRRGEAPLSGQLPCYGVYETQDGRYMSLAALEPQFWAGFCEAVARPQWLDAGLDPGPRGAEVRAELAALFATRGRDAWVAAFEGLDLCCEPVLEGHELGADPLLEARGAFFELPHPRLGPLAQTATPVRFMGAAEARAHQPAPTLGEHTDAALEAVGVDAEARARLRAQGVIA